MRKRHIERQTDRGAVIKRVIICERYRKNENNRDDLRK